MSCCYRCGSCCKGTINLIPKTENSNLSPKFIIELIEEKGLSETYDYIDNNTEEMGPICKWLKQNSPNEKACCLVYNLRGSSCIDYDSDYCNVGFNYWVNLIRQGLTIPIDIFEEIRKHPLWSTVYQRIR